MSQLTAEWQRAFAWVEATLAGELVRHERQPRWRPAWNLDVERGGRVLPLHFRGARIERGVYPLSRERDVLVLLERQGIPVPHVYGFCPDPEGILMDRAPGRANLKTAADAGERDSVQRHYMELLAQMHGIDVALCESIGMQRPRSAEELARGDLDFYLRRSATRSSSPSVIEFALGCSRASAARPRAGGVPDRRRRPVLFDQGA